MTLYCIIIRYNYIVHDQLDAMNHAVKGQVESAHAHNSAAIISSYTLSMQTILVTTNWIVTLLY